MDYTKIYCTIVYKGLVPYTITILYSTQVDITVVCYTMLCILLYITVHYLSSPGVTADEVGINISNAFQESMLKCTTNPYKFASRFTYKMSRKTSRGPLLLPCRKLSCTCSVRTERMFCINVLDQSC